jgi:hypothetical protein
LSAVICGAVSNLRVWEILMRGIREWLGGTITALAIFAGPALGDDLRTGTKLRFEFTHLGDGANAGQLSNVNDAPSRAGTPGATADNTPAPAGGEAPPMDPGTSGDNGMPSDGGTPSGGAMSNDGAMPSEGMPTDGEMPGGQTPSDSSMPGDGASPGSADGAKTASSVQDTDVYHHNDGKSRKFCTMYVGDKGAFVEAKADQPDWVFLKGISGDCKGKDGWVWNGGSLKIE